MGAIPVRHIHNSKIEPVLSGSFDIRAIEVILEGEDMVEDLHRHDFFYMLILEKGDGSHEIDFLPYEVADNSIFLMRPGQVHKLTLKAGSKGYLVQFKNEFLYSQNLQARDLLRKVSHKKICTLEQNNFQKLTAILDYMLREYLEKQEGYEEVIKSNLGIFFIELVRHRKNKEDKSTVEDHYAQEKLEEFFELLDLHIKETKQVSDYANMINLSIYQLNSITRTLLNRKPSEIINEHILLESKRLLLATSSQVNQIAYYLGYEDPSYFIRFFKKHTGYSPEAFRSLSK